MTSVSVPVTNETRCNHAKIQCCYNYPANITCSKSTIKTVVKGGKNVQS